MVIASVGQRMAHNPHMPELYDLCDEMGFLVQDEAFDEWVRKRTPAGRWGEPDEIAGLAVFLASSAANYITGQTIMIDGGMSVAL